MSSEFVVTSVCICTECGRNFILTDGDDANEWYYGHDCDEWVQSDADEAPEWEQRGIRYEDEGRGLRLCDEWRARS